jgi:3-oxoacyl-[acyl-carrier protein] reductase
VAKLEKAKEDLESKYGIKVLAIPADISAGADNEQTAKSVVEQAVATFGRVDVLINNAGVDVYKLITETSLTEWEKVFNINMTSAYQITNAFINGMIDKQFGRIINISSMWGLVGASMEVCYSASKSALIGYTKALAKELAPNNITVNCICPGVIDTPINARFSLEDINSLKEQTPLGRIGTPTDISKLVYFLSGDNASFITGQVISVDGGFSL